MPNRDLRTFIDRPDAYFDGAAQNAFALERESLERLQLAALQERHGTFIERIPVLQRMAAEQRFTRLNTLSDVIPLLFPHTVYKSYPFSFLEHYQLERLTQWLSKLTTVDLSGVNAKGLRSLDEWTDLIKTRTPLRLIHSSGTSGKMSFIPKSEADIERWARCFGLGCTAFGDEPGPRRFDLTGMPIVRPWYRYGAREHMLDAMKQLNGLGEEGLYTLYPGRLSADMMLLAGRLRSAEVKGESVALVLDEQMQARRAEFMRMQEELPQAAERFWTRVTSELKGRRVFVFSTYTAIYNAAAAGLQAGIRDLFAPDSIVVCGGGNKGTTLPANFRDTVREFIGRPRVHEMYGMTEVLSNNILCPHNHYHINPWVIPFVVDPKTGAELPRTGAQTGRMAYYDLGAEAHWGGLITSDRATMHWWDDPCGCGRKGPYVEATITRFSEHGEDDKISCAGVPDAHDKALSYFLSHT